MVGHGATPLGLHVHAPDEGFELIGPRADLLKGGKRVGFLPGSTRPPDLGGHELAQADACWGGATERTEGRPRVLVHGDASHARTHRSALRGSLFRSDGSFARRHDHVISRCRVDLYDGRERTLRLGSLALQPALSTHVATVAPLYTAPRCNCVPVCELGV